MRGHAKTKNTPANALIPVVPCRENTNMMHMQRAAPEGVPNPAGYREGARSA